MNKKNPRKTWMLIDELTSRKCGKIRNIFEINEIVNSADEMAEAFNDFFTTIGPNLANEILPSDIDPESYPQPTDKTFSLKAPSVSELCESLSQINGKKAIGLDRTKIFKSCIGGCQPIPGDAKRQCHGGHVEWQNNRFCHPAWLQHRCLLDLQGLVANYVQSRLQVFQPCH